MQTPADGRANPAARVATVATGAAVGALRNLLMAWPFTLGFCSSQPARPV